MLQLNRRVDGVATVGWCGHCGMVWPLWDGVATVGWWKKSSRCLFLAIICVEVSSMNHDDTTVVRDVRKEQKGWEA